MAEGLINEIVAQEAFTQLTELVDGVNLADDAMSALLKTSSKLYVSLKASTNMAGVSSGISDANENVLGLVDSQNKLIISSQNVAKANAAMGGGMADTIVQYAEAKAEIAELSKALAFMNNDYEATKVRIAELNKAFDAGTITNRRYAEQLGEATEANVRLKQSITETTSQIKSQTDIGLAKQAEALQKQILAQQAAEIKQVASAAKVAEAAQRSYDKQVIAAQRAEIKQVEAATNKANREQAAYDKTILAAQRAEIKQVQAATRASEKIQQQEVNAAMKSDGLASRFKNQLIRGVGSLVIWSVLFEGISKVGEALYNAIPGTEGYIQKQKQLQETLSTTESEFAALIDKVGEFQKSIDNGLGNGEAQYQSQIDQAKALGVVKGAEYENELRQFKATQELRDKQIHDLDELGQKYYKLNEIFSEVDKGHSNLGRLRGEIKGLGLSDEDYAKYTQILNDFLKARQDKPDMKLYGNPDITKAQSDNATKSNVTAQQKIDEQTAFDSVSAKKIYDKKIELDVQLSSTREQLRQANEKEDVESLDKVVNDTRVKYALLADDIKKNREKYRLSMTSADDAAYTDKNTQAYDRLLSTLRSIGAQEQKNLSYELAQRQYKNDSSVNSGLSAGAAGIAKDSSGFGIPNYDNNAAALDLQTAAKKDALKLQFQQLAETITDSGQIIEAQKQLDEKLKQIDKDAYKERLTLAEDYFNKITEQVTAQTSILLSEEERRSLNHLTQITKGGGSTARKEKSIFYEQQADIKAKANIGLQDVNQKLPSAQEAFGRADDATKGPLSPDASDEAQKAKTSAQKVYDGLLEQKADYENKIASADEEIKQKKKQGQEEIKQQAIQLAEETVQAITTIQDNQFAHEQQQLEIQMQRVTLAAQQKEQAIAATTQFQVTKSNQLSLLAAQTKAEQDSIQQKENQLAVKKARADRTAAEAGIILNTAVGITKILASDAYDPIEAGILIALTTAIGAAQFAAAASAPIPQYRYGTPSTTTPLFIAGEAGENEWIQNPSGEGKWSGTSAKLFHEPLGTSVTPISKIRDFANSHVAPKYDVTMSAGNMAQEITDGINKVAAEIGGNIVYAIMRNSSNGGNKDNSFLESAYFNSKLQSKG